MSVGTSSRSRCGAGRRRRYASSVPAAASRSGGTPTGVPHVFAKTEPSVFYGAGWAAAADRGLLMELARGPGRLACIDAPGYDAFSVALSGRQFVPSARTEARLRDAAEVAHGRGRATGAARRRRVRRRHQCAASRGAAADRAVDADGRRRDDVPARRPLRRRRRRGDLARAAPVGSARRELGQRAGPHGLERPARAPGPRDADDDRQAVPVRAADGRRARRGERRPRRCVTSSRRWTSGRCRTRSSSARARSATGRPIMVAGPQLGFFYPEFFMELDLEGGGVSVRGGVPRRASRTC